jgi:hypothetical protein
VGRAVAVVVVAVVAEPLHQVFPEDRSPAAQAVVAVVASAIAAAASPATIVAAS